jgi:hypothetical protein
MANTRARNVVIVDTTGAISGNLTICGIKYVPLGTTPSATIKEASSSGTVLWEDSGSTNVWNPECEIKCPEGIYVTLAGTGTKVYLYCK